MLIMLQMVQAILLLYIPIQHMLHELTVLKILIIMPIVTLLNQLIYPSQITLLPRILKSNEDLLKGNTLFTFAYQGSDALFNALAGVIISGMGIYAVYFLNSSTFMVNAILFIYLSTQISSPSQTDISTQKNVLKQYKKDFNEGLSVWNDKILLPLLIGVMVINFATTSIYANLPAFSQNNTHYSFLMASSGVGILIGGLLLNKFKLNKFKLNKIYIISVFFIGIFWGATTFITDTSLIGQLSMVILFLLGWIPVGSLNILSQTVIQLMVPQEKMGSAMSSMIGLSIMFSPIGALFGGYLGQQFGPSLAILVSGMFFMVIGSFWITQKSIRSLSSIENISNGV